MGTFSQDMRLVVVALLVVGCWTAPTPDQSVVSRDCTYERVETITGDDCRPRTVCEVIQREDCREIPYEVCSNTGCVVEYKEKCEIAFEHLCKTILECPVCPDSPSVGYDGPYDHRSVGYDDYYDGSYNDYDPSSVGSHDSKSPDSNAQQDDSKNPLLKFFT